MCQLVRTGVHCFKRSEINGLHRLSQATGEKIFIPGENFHEDILPSAHKCYFCLWVSLPCRRRHASHKVFPKKDWCVCVCVCALYFDEVDPCAALGWTSHSAQVC